MLERLIGRDRLAKVDRALASVLIGAGVSRGDYRSVLAIALLTALAIGGYYWYQRPRQATLSPRP